MAEAEKLRSTRQKTTGKVPRGSTASSGATATTSLRFDAAEANVKQLDAGQQGDISPRGEGEGCKVMIVEFKESVVGQKDQAS